MGSTSLQIWMKIWSRRASTKVRSLTGLGRMMKVSRTSISTEVKSEISVAANMKKNMEK